MSEHIPLPLGFSSAGIRCGIKSDPQKLDLALLVSDRPCAAAGVFTTNLVCGAPVKVSRERLPRSTARAVVLNSGNSNAATGDRGIADAKRMTQIVADQIGASQDDVLVASTGVIGRFLPMDVLQAGIPVAAKALSDSSESFLLAAKAMMTTDTFPKQATETIRIGGNTVRISGVCKGAAMIAPNMATMLCVIMTDAGLTPEEAKQWLRASVEDSFNCISVDGHESTSDTVILLANGASGITISSADEGREFQQALDRVAMKLATDIIRDAEGAHHFVELNVTGCRTRDEAFTIAKAVAESPLVKTAICGADPNWGRIVSAAGYAGVPLQESDMSLVVNGFLLYQAGAPVDFDAKQVSSSLRDNRNVTIDLKLTHGNAQVRFWTCDLTKEYVELNADYTT
ncbi:bifunctional glutamate N-acetyltransferase/amino-acid acetyltransferase ArgJ [Schlesneria paludicola]|uniref:bifunctional glutamate N-acetyltransferase/amino-acid acetyltransferase ArgJ n=1 Tax=Schlesneria paludicola TaxID=360056 RepID=UPI00029ADF87|nr:bifunctional glutamate N-acetyltransferase/amino-acid acetyltransferase ArgJ [Schlesneria paludicola]